MRSLPEYKEIITDSVFEIPQRVKEYDPSFFIVRNHKTHKFEVHSTDNMFDSYCFTVNFDELDQRTLDIVMKNDTNKKGARELEREIDEHNEKIEKARDRDFHNWAESVAKETYSHWKKDLDYEYIGTSKKVIE